MSASPSSSANVYVDEYEVFCTLFDAIVDATVEAFVGVDE
jgi:hypothetical protein